MIFYPSSNHWRVRDYVERVTRAQLREVLLNQPNPIFEGTPMKWGHRHIGVGVYELFKEDM